ncbi:3-methyladenine DNA glycosylase AlkD [Geodermatophilus saharensis]|uniref:3-methyladenine DNA glycosylase AlkD n=1 Tax=Geodermatophilus saharensis TaxID=1137994 RepID=A0A239I410_9ACTN|nr:DNA alkylation repair protein [Geodermatophilus saharensis]SNS88028.1 3-methyladenine DNA glycosylase AlkD [Geodermatophilus saharensis]
MAGVAEVLGRLRALADPARLPGMARSGIGGADVLGVTVAELRALARDLGRDHTLAGGLWDSGVHEARILASMVEEPAAVDGRQLDAWAAGFDSWDLCDQVCQNLVRRTPLAWAKALEWSARPEPFVKRAGFAVMAGLAVADERADDARFEPFLRAVAERADDDRPLVRKGASWALRQMGKRSPGLHARAVETASGLRSAGPGARWVAADVLRELQR